MPKVRLRKTSTIFKLMGGLQLIVGILMIITGIRTWIEISAIGNLNEPFPGFIEVHPTGEDVLFYLCFGFIFTVLSLSLFLGEKIFWLFNQASFVFLYCFILTLQIAVNVTASNWGESILFIVFITVIFLLIHLITNRRSLLTRINITMKDRNKLFFVAGTAGVLAALLLYFLNIES